MSDWQALGQPDKVLGGGEGGGELLARRVSVYPVNAIYGGGGGG